jgi:hypothetical protein
MDKSITDYALKNTDPEDIEDLLGRVETSFDIKFVGDELVHIKTFGQLCDHIANKIQIDNSGDCTSQQAFYKLRHAISSTLQIDHKSISTDTALIEILPRHCRRSRTKKLEKHLGFKINILRPPHWVTGTLIIVFFASPIGFCFNWQIGLLGLGFSIGGLWFSYKIGNELDLKTVGQVAQKMTREHYLKSRRNPSTFNKNEIEKILIDWFSIDFDIDKSKLTRGTKFL